MVALSNLIHKKINDPEPVSQLIALTKSVQGPYPLLNVAHVAIKSHVQPELKSLTPTDLQQILDYLAAIGETNQDSIDEMLDNCAANPDLLAFELRHIEKYFKTQRGDLAGLVKCQNCIHLSGDTCLHYGWRVVVEQWRRCNTQASV
jgi:hypothetical protein